MPKITVVHSKLMPVGAGYASVVGLTHLTYFHGKSVSQALFENNLMGRVLYIFDGHVAAIDVPEHHQLKSLT